MKKLVFFLFLFAASVSSLSAQKYLTRTGHIWFFSSTPVEDIEAHTRQATSILNGETGEVVFQVLMKGFQFEKALMQEHFNEKYVESDKYPKAVFKGQIEDFDALNLNESGTHEVTVAGTLTLHGKTQQVSAPGKLVISDSGIAASSEFVLKLEDYDIKVPGVVREKIAETISIHVDLNYEKM